MKLNYRVVTTASVAFLAAGTMVFGADNAKTISLLNGKDLTGWKIVGKGASAWTYGKAAMDPSAPAKLQVVGPGEELISTNKTVNLSTEAVFGDCVVETEFLVAAGGYLA